MLSVVIITKNEQANIQACLESVAFADQIVVLDGGSTDRTRDLAEELGADVYINEDWKGFGVQKNRALEYGRHEWVLVLDADERVPASLAKEIMSAVSQCNGPSAYSLKRQTLFYGLPVRYGGFEPIQGSVRLFKRGCYRFDNALVHEKIDLNGDSAGLLRTPLEHLSYQDPDAYLQKLMVYSKLSAAILFNRGKRASAYSPMAHAVAAFLKSFLIKLGILDGKTGLLIATLHAEHTYHKYFQLYLMSRHET